MADVLENTFVKIDGQEDLAGVRTVILGGDDRVYFSSPLHGRVYIPKEKGIKDGTVLEGTATYCTATYPNDEDGNPRAKPLVRIELQGFVSFDSQLSVAYKKRKITNLETMVLTAEHYKVGDVSMV